MTNQSASGSELEGKDEEKNQDDDVDLAEHPVGASREVERKLTDVLHDGVQSGSLGELLKEYNPEEFNTLVDDISEVYTTKHRRELKYQFGALAASAVFILALFFGMTYYVVNTGTRGSALIFFAGSLSGYFMRLAAEKF